MDELSKSDAELCYKYARDSFRADIEADAYSRALDTWQADNPDALESLEAANDDPDHAFAWDELWLEMQQRDLDDNEDLVPLWGADINDSDVADLASEFGWGYVTEIRRGFRRAQESTAFSPREFVALVLDAAENTPEEIATHEMDVSVGNFRGKKGRIADKIDRASETENVAQRVRA